jgi:enoyl-CoA hydratase/carnithine racemase
VLEVVLSRPQRHNAYDHHMRDALVEALRLAAADATIEGVLLRGDGPSFCSGGDLAEFGTSADPATAHHVRLSRSAAYWMERIGPRMRATVHGRCIGAGVELAAYAGTVIADRDATFQLPEVAMGLVPGAGGTVSVPRRIGPWRTAWLALTGTTVDATTARSWGLVDRVVQASSPAGTASAR